MPGADFKGCREMVYVTSGLWGEYHMSILSHLKKINILIVFNSNSSEIEWLLAACLFIGKPTMDARLRVEELH